jgi:acyl-CoA synthetase (AMP-forming)/AMP-acid ligase II
MPPVAFLRRPARWLEAITRHRATISGGPNFAYDLCVGRITAQERVGLDLSTWQVAFNGAEPVRAATLERFADAFAGCGFRRTAFYPCYGLAEATLMVSGGLRSEAPRMVESSDGTRKVSCGSVIDDQELLIVDPTTCTGCPPGRVGEIWINGPSVAHGYWDQPELTRQAFGGHLADSLAGPYLRTGDLGFIHAGEVYVTGRLKTLLIVGGRNLQAEDVEQTIATSHTQGWPGGVAAVSIDEAGRERLVVLQEVATRARTDLDAIVRAIRLRVAEHHQVPVSTVVLMRPGKIPRTSSGKVRRHVCREAFLSGSLEALLEWRLGGRP